MGVCIGSENMMSILKVIVALLSRNDFVLGTSSSSSYPQSCIGLEDGYYELQMIDSDEYPTVTQKCSNDYIILDYSIDNNIKNYFSSWDELCTIHMLLIIFFVHSLFKISKLSAFFYIFTFFYFFFYSWHLETSGPENTDHVNWRQWYLPDSSTTSHEYLVSPDCNTCESEANNQLYDKLTTYWLTGSIFGCFWTVLGQHNCDVDYDSLDCYTCAEGIVLKPFQKI